MEPSFRILGPVALHVDDQGMFALGDSNRVLILAVLLHSLNRPVSDGELLDHVWGEATRTRGALHPEIRRAREILERHGFGAGRQIIQRTAGGYMLRGTPEQVDWHLFRSRVAEARQARHNGALAEARDVLYSALDLWSGDPLIGLDGPRIDGLRQSMNEARRQARLDLVEVRLELGEEHSLVGDLVELSGRYRNDEAVTRHLMTALHRCGRGHEALDAAREFQRRLRDQGFAPSDRINELYQRILRQDASLRASAIPDPQPAPAPNPTVADVPAPRSPTPATSGGPAGPAVPADIGRVPTEPQASLRPPDRPFTLHRDTPDFVGRAAEIDTIMNSVRGSGAVPRVWNITGMSGIGKTALAVRIAHQLRSTFPDAQLQVDLRVDSVQRTPRDSAEVLHQLLRSYEGAEARIPQARDALAARWRDRTAQARMLLVLDDAASSAQVRHLLPESPHSLVLITSRRHLADLEGVRTLTLDAPEWPDALALFHQCSGRDREEDEAPIADIVRWCSSHPLSLRILAAKLREHPARSPVQVYRQVCTSPAPIAEIRGGDQELDSRFELALHDLAPDHAWAFRMLGLLAGGVFTSFAVSTLLDCAPARADRIVEDLLRHSLLAEPSSGWYRFHDLLGAFARQQADEHIDAEERTAAVRRLLEQHLVTAEAAVRTAYPHTRRPSVTDHGDHQPFSNTQAAVEWLHTHREWLLHTARIAREHGFAEYEANLAYVLVEHLSVDPTVDSTPRLYMRAVQVWEEKGESKRTAWAQLDLARIWMRQGMHRAAKACGHQALAVLQDVGDAVETARAMNQVGDTHRQLGELNDAVRIQSQALSIMREVGDLSDVGTALLYYGIAWFEMGSYNNAKPYFEEAYSIFTKIGDAAKSTMAIANIAGIHLNNGEPQRSLDISEHTVHMYHSLGMRHHEALTIGNIGWAHHELGNYDTALEHFQEARSMFKEIGATRSMADVDCNAGDTHLRREDFGRAVEAYERARTTTEGTREFPDRAWITATLGLGNVRYAQARYAEAIDYYSAAAEAARNLGSPLHEGQAEEGIGDCRNKVSTAHEAQIHWLRALSLLDQHGSSGVDRIRAKLNH
ncbi:tetratricopeptide repeat protein [Lipingzhangella sp. LS1_29]|uniref:Tetratricopeptide repeat protein n=1 Tax=Lipingzhangella rawalii TaxID=2055835 RepID=A0ABU2HB09_9ACTN|nr:tetratricopeptide repeat protein [Lipingzhangella rawalii]MDS1272448.1 tetratricopeptide repeat protein [Lipingzhangella rawalii]